MFLSSRSSNFKVVSIKGVDVLGIDVVFLVEVVVGKFDSVVIKGCKLIVDGLVDVEWLVEDSVDVDFNRLVYEIVDDYIDNVNLCRTLYQE